MNEAIQVIAAVIKDDDRYLLCQRPLDKRHGGLWEFPGGKLEAGESFLAGARRELREELGLSIRAISEVRFFAGDPGSQFVINFVFAEADGEPAPTEHIACRWFTFDELQSLPLAPSDRQFVDYLNRAPDTSTLS